MDIYVGTHMLFESQVQRYSLTITVRFGASISLIEPFELLIYRDT